MATPLRVAIFGLISPHPGRNRGGTAVFAVRLANHLVARGVEVDLLGLANALNDRSLMQLDCRVHRHSIHWSRRFGIFAYLAMYLAKYRPHATISLDNRANSIACWTRWIPLLRRPVIASIHSSFHGKLDRGSSTRRRRRALARIARHADELVAVSEGLAEEIAAAAGTRVSRIRVIPPLAVDDHWLCQAEGCVNHPWFAAPRGSRDRPVILGAGRLEGQKDFPTLLRAFARLRRRRAARLVILGQGSRAAELDELARALAIAGDVAFAGFVDNAAAWMAAADLFALSSRSEGFGMVLAEAMAAGCPVVSTDCRFGPREILDDGRYGRLVPVGDDDALAEAMERTLDRPPAPALLRAAAARYSVECNGDAYLALIRDYRY